MEIELINNYYPELDDYIEIGWYKSLDDVLKNCMIQNIPFKKAIMADETEILRSCCI